MGKIINTVTPKSKQERFSVALRIRPLNAAEEVHRKQTNHQAAIFSNSETRQVTVPPFAASDTVRNCVNDHNRRKGGAEALSSHRIAATFEFDHVFWSVDGVKDLSGAEPVGQEEVYSEIGKPLVDHAFEGFNACLLAYGQTGSGKTYTMMGADVSDIGDNPNAGIIPRLCRDIFLRKEAAERDGTSTWSVEIGYVEVYNEKVTDLLARRKKGMEDEDVLVEVRDNPLRGVYLEGQKILGVSSVDDVLCAVQKGNLLRRTAATKMNIRSSRSHAILMVKLKEKRLMTTKKLISIKTSGLSSRLNLVDLAGSERASKSEIEGAQLSEVNYINLSLTTLGRIIDILSDKKTSNAFVPFRDSKLTHILKDSLRGNSRTSMIATVSPSLLDANETLSTLNYASRARDIVNSVRANENDKARKIRELEEELKNLKAELNKNGPVSNMEEVSELKNRIILLTSEAESKAAEFQLFEKERESEKKKLELLNASEAERMRIEEEAQRLKEEVERYSVQADSIAEENAGMKEEMENLRRQVQVHQEERYTKSTEENKNMVAMQEQLTEAEKKLVEEKEERRNVERRNVELASELAQARLHQGLSESLRDNDESKDRLQENKTLAERVTGLEEEIEVLRIEKEQWDGMQIENNRSNSQLQLAMVQLEEMEKRYYATIFFFQSYLEQKEKWEERLRHRIEIEHEAQVEKVIQSAEDKNAVQEELRSEIYSLRVQNFEQLGSAQKLRDESEAEINKLKQYCSAMELAIKQKESEGNFIISHNFEELLEFCETRAKLEASRDNLFF